MKEKKECAHLWRNGLFLILKPNVVQGRVADGKSETCWARVLKGQPKFIISNIDFTKDINPPTEKSKAASLTTNTTGFNNMQKEELALMSAS